MPAHWFRVFRRAAALVLGTAVLAAPAFAAGERHFSFGYDQPHTTGYGIVADLFAAKLGELSKGKFVIDQFPGAQLGQEPQIAAEDSHRRHPFYHVLDRERLDCVAAIRRLLAALH